MIAVNPLFFGFLAVPIDWLPPAGEAASHLGPLLAAQAAIAALSLAVVLFALERVSARPDADDRIFNEYVRRSRVWPIFLSSLGAVAVTGLILVVYQFEFNGFTSAEPTPLRNLSLVVGAAFAVSVVLPGLLLDRTMRLTQPSAWRQLRREVNELSVRDSVRRFIARQRRLQRGDLRKGEDAFTVEFFPDPGEGSADEAIRELLEDATRAIDERRDADFNRSLDSIVSLVEHAMDDLSKHDWKWGEPGSEAKWPPLAELGRNLYRLRDAAVRVGDSEHADGLVTLSSKLALLGIERRCGELFTAALTGLVANYRSASHARRDELRQLFRNAAWLDLAYAFTAQSSSELPYLREAARHQAIFLFRAIHGGHADDFEEFVRLFAGMLSNIRGRERMHARHAQRERNDGSVEASWVDQALPDGRVALIEAGGMAVLLAASDSLADPQPYLDVVRREYRRLEQLVHDIGRSVEVHYDNPYFWTDRLDSAPAITWPESVPMNPAAPFVTLRVLELASDSMSEIDFHGQSRVLLNWFTTHAAQVEPYLRPENDIPIERRREIVLEALEAAGS